MFDKHDCMLVAYGDPAVEEPFRRYIFGLFQQSEPEYPEWILEIAKHYSNFRTLIHGILFVYAKRNLGPFDLRFSFYLIPNIHLVDTKGQEYLFEEIKKANN